MKTDTVNTERLEVSNNLDKEGEKYVPAYFVYAKKIRCECSILPPGYGFTEAEQLESRDNAKYNADLIATAVNACKEINPDNPLNVASHLVELVETYKKLQTELEHFINATPTGDKRVQLTGLNILALWQLNQVTE